MIRSFFIPAFILALTACGSSTGDKIGDPCQTEGSLSEECGDGAVCTPEGTALVCLKICDKQEDCAADEACNGLTGNTKSCQPK